MAVAAPIITATDDEIIEVLTTAQLPPLLSALAWLTGDLSLLRDDLRIDPLAAALPGGGYSPEQTSTILALAAAALMAYRDGGCVPAAPPTTETLHAIMQFCAGEPIRADYVPLLIEELNVSGEDLRAPRWDLAHVAPERTFTVAVIGAGMSGLLAAHRLVQTGVDVVILDKNPDVGGTWWENTYPGARVDTPNHFYSYSFEQRTDWPLHFSTQEVLLDYFRSCADHWGLGTRLRLSTEVSAAVFDEIANTWTLEVRGPDGEETLTVDAVVCAVGQLNRPKTPTIAGQADFAGPVFHSAQWDHSLDLAGKRVAVIGSGASAVQFIPTVAEQAGHLDVFQRTPNWFLPVPHYHAGIEPGLQWLLDHVPGYASWWRFWICWRLNEGMLAGCRVDPGWTGGPGSVSQANKDFRDLLAMYIEFSLADRPDLLAKVLPAYPPGSKRIVLDDGTWFSTLRRDDVDLITDPIDSITATGVVTRAPDGTTTEHPADVIIYGTGFEASKFLTPMKFVGRGGVDLHERWNGEARAYNGVTIPNFPNLFLLYGPNTNIVVNGSIVFFSECEVDYVVDAVHSLLAGGHHRLEVKQSVHDEYNAKIDAENGRWAWGVSNVPSWYKNDSGRVAQNWPFSLLEFWQRTRAVDPADYEFT